MFSSFKSTGAGPSDKPRCVIVVGRLLGELHGDKHRSVATCASRVRTAARSARSLQCAHAKLHTPLRTCAFSNDVLIGRHLNRVFFFLFFAFFKNTVE